MASLLTQFKENAWQNYKTDVGVPFKTKGQLFSLCSWVFGHVGWWFQSPLVAACDKKYGSCRNSASSRRKVWDLHALLSHKMGLRAGLVGSK